MDFNKRLHVFSVLTDHTFNYFAVLTRSLREPGIPCTKYIEVSESRMERVNKDNQNIQTICEL